ncbi:UNVERIFIED_CONTAM: hypothetical protein GTU68_012671 [Idotea baltica]|nr:hypothetical protein [Idotea baltica]
MPRAQLINDISVAAEALRAGKLVAFATETVYGLGANALDTNAVANIFAAKGRPHFDPLIVHLADAEQVISIVTEVSDVAQTLMNEFWPGPLTLVLPKREIVPDLVTAGLPSVAVRVPDHPQARELLRSTDIPVAAPSANPFGRISPTTAAHVMKHLGDQIDYVLDGGPCRVGVESTVLKVDGDQVQLLRPGGVTRELIEALIGPIQTTQSSGDQAPQTAPGMLASHYAPRTPLNIVNRWEDFTELNRVGILSFGPLENLERFGDVRILSPRESLTEATANFFAMLRELDESGVDQIIAQRFPDHGLGIALNDRLTRAAAR